MKYHLGAEGTFRTPDGAELSVTLSPNPSHLEAVNPVVEGRARAQQSDRRAPLVAVDRQKTLPILIHGDAAFAAQGVVAETFNMARLAGYTTGGTIHIIANNQIGFTTGPTRGSLHHLLQRPGQGLRRTDHPRQRRRPGGDAWRRPGWR